MPLHKEELVTDAAFQDHPVHLALLENQERTASLEHQEFPEHPADPQRCLANRSLRHHVNHAHKDHRDLQVPQEQAATSVHQANQEDQEMTPHPENQGLKDHQDHQENQDNQDQLENQEHPPSAKLLFQVNPAQLEIKEPQAPQDQQDNQAQTDYRELQDRKDPADPKDLPETMDNPVLKVHLDLLELLEKRASARNTAPSMVEFSSRTELVVKKSWINRLNLFVYSWTAISLFIQWNLPFKCIQSSFVNFKCNKVRI